MKPGHAIFVHLRPSHQVVCGHGDFKPSNVLEHQGLLGEVGEWNVSSLDIHVYYIYS